MSCFLHMGKQNSTVHMGEIRNSSASENLLTLRIFLLTRTMAVNYSVK
jgi:hypothetical protein